MKTTTILALALSSGLNIYAQEENNTEEVNPYAPYATYDAAIFAAEEADRRTWQWEEAERLNHDPVVLQRVEEIRKVLERHEGPTLREEGVDPDSNQPKSTFPKGFPDAPDAPK